MKQEIKIPAMGESVTEATIASFLKPAGASVKESEEIVELETEKVNQVLYAPVSGVIEWTVKIGDTVPIGTVIGYVDSEKAPKEEVKKPKEQEKPAPKKEEKRAPPPPTEKPSEKMRFMKEEFVSELKEKPAAPEKKEAQAPLKEEKIEKKETGRETRRKMSKIRQTIGKRLVEALHQAAMLSTFNEVDMSRIMELRARHKESFQQKHGVKLGLMSFFVKAVVDGLKAFPDFNSYIDKEEIVTRSYYDIGIAVGTDRGLVVPVLRGCDTLSFAEIEKEIDQFAKKAKENKLTIDDLSGGGFTITNGGVYGSLLSTPILNPPQVGILGMHKILKRPVVVDDEIVIRPMMYLALSYDHRLVDGKQAVTFLMHIKEVLEDPSQLLFLDTEA